MAKIKLEYIWLDGYTPVAGLRGKTKIVDGDPEKFTLEDCPMWGFDGSSTKQAEGKSSDCLLQPVGLYKDISRTNAFIVMTEVLMPDGTPHVTNTRATVEDDEGAWFGFEQEYFFYQDGRPLGFPEGGFPGPQGPYYCGAGFSAVGDIAREIVEMWVARYLMLRLGEKYGVDINFHCKPILGAYADPLDWNGSGMHCNFSTTYMREVGGKDYFEKLMEAFNKYRDEHVAVYGPDNHLRLTGLHETQSIDKFSYGIADRGASIRVPHSFVKAGYKGYLEDRRPNSAGDPYAIASRVIKTINTVPTS